MQRARWRPIAIHPVSTSGSFRRSGAAREAKRRDNAGNRSTMAKQPHVDELAERRREAERVRQARERQRLERELATARAELERRERALSGLQAELRGVEQGVEQARTHLQDLERALSRLGGAREGRVSLTAPSGTAPFGRAASSLT
jgi:chromosome segregation ATPase